MNRLNLPNCCWSKEVFDKRRSGKMLESPLLPPIAPVIPVPVPVPVPVPPSPPLMVNNNSVLVSKPPVLPLVPWLPRR
uniref:Uncharacterized protein n=1 Tax=Ciona savignyi TaxID=51511 RepID=H2Z4I2_CIOSA